MCGEVKVNRRVLLKRYHDEVMCDVVPMHVRHILFERPWQYDRYVIHDGYKNRYNFNKDGKSMRGVKS